MFTHNTLSLKNDYENLIKKKQNDVYLFGYGSLLWKVTGFEYDKIIYGYVNEFQRQFWLLSDDHRGTAEKMGRVLTLVKNNSNSVRVYGIAYRIKSDDMKKTFDDLNFREKCGYSLKEIDFYPNDNQSEPFKCVCYFANEENVYYSPNNNINEMAQQIFETVGPSGTNKEYLFNFCDSLRHIATCINDDKILIYDYHLFELEKLVKNLDVTTIYN